MVIDHNQSGLYDEGEPVHWYQRHGQRSAAFVLPPRSMVGQLTLDQHIGVRIPGGQPIQHLPALLRTFPNSLVQA